MVAWERIFRGKRLPKMKVLDVGAGVSVDSRATHAIDKFHTPHIEDYPNSEKVSNVEYYPKHIDVDKSALPYEDEFFDEVVSWGAWGYNFGNIRSGKELKRVLKTGGTIEVGIDATNLEHAKRLLTRAGFKIIDISAWQDWYKITAVK